ncbi:unnamed protein product [Fusarium graminearum]|uniref:Chromosome 4, complete genome n=2 Tax=Gibberella zeae TaxID=5518 RepID=A0A098DN20_GIBZE|nr:unnamed protein product [Fusarium graminearum]CAF3631713.1 unnamed protein product [Fusarium graminearum]CAG1993625.1 unnamed protein product [Fusarium graminearum]CAG2011847.1 unnamed protein product [Fusarium graminearum]CEF83266.1 unnamed protein product [Fusarium graminearum]
MTLGRGVGADKTCLSPSTFGNPSSSHRYSHSKVYSWKRQDTYTQVGQRPEGFGASGACHFIWTAVEEAAARVEMPSYLAKLSNGMTTDSK